MYYGNCAQWLNFLIIGNELSRNDRGILQYSEALDVWMCLSRAIGWCIYIYSYEWIWLQHLVFSTRSILTIDENEWAIA